MPWVADAERFCCVQCHKTFGGFRNGHHHCRACGGNFCGTCSKTSITIVKGHGPEKTLQRVCDVCAQVRQRRLAECRGCKCFTTHWHQGHQSMLGLLFVKFSIVYIPLGYALCFQLLLCVRPRYLTFGGRIPRVQGFHRAQAINPLHFVCLLCQIQDEVRPSGLGFAFSIASVQLPSASDVGDFGCPGCKSVLAHCTPGN